MVTGLTVVLCGVLTLAIGAVALLLPRRVNEKDQ